MGYMKCTQGNKNIIMKGGEKRGGKKSPKIKDQKWKRRWYNEE
jgi:hypothetical protein